MLAFLLQLDMNSDRYDDFFFCLNVEKVHFLQFSCWTATILFPQNSAECLPGRDQNYSKLWQIL